MVVKNVYPSKVIIGVEDSNIFYPNRILKLVWSYGPIHNWQSPSWWLYVFMIRSMIVSDLISFFSREKINLSTYHSLEFSYTIQQRSIVRRALNSHWFSNIGMKKHCSQLGLCFLNNVFTAIYNACLWQHIQDKILQTTVHIPSPILKEFFIIFPNHYLHIKTNKTQKLTTFHHIYCVITRFPKTPKIF